MLAKFRSEGQSRGAFFQTRRSITRSVRDLHECAALQRESVGRHSSAAESQDGEFMNANIPGVSVPQEMIDELKAAGDKAEDGRGDSCADHQCGAYTLRRGAYHGDQGHPSPRRHHY
jgi:hypothetical protein